MKKSKEFFMKNNKGDIPIVILVVEVILICAITILSFAYFNLNFNEGFLGIGLIETVSSISEENLLYQQTSFSSNYGNLFESEGLKITITGKEIEGTYTTKGAPFFGSEKVVARVRHNLEQ